MNNWSIDNNWTLFLDRDGVFNRKIEGDYVRNIQQLQILEGVLIAIPLFNQLFKRVVMVTNQQGIGKQLMTTSDMATISQHLQQKIQQTGGHIDAIYYCPHLAELNCNCRKPQTGMAQQAQLDFPEIRFNQSIMVGDSISDMEFGRRLGMKTVFLTNDEIFSPHPFIDVHFNTLIEFAEWVVGVGGSK